MKMGACESMAETAFHYDDLVTHKLVCCFLELAVQDRLN